MNKTEKQMISVIIPCYNQGKFVNDAVESVLNQTYQNFEIIIINDGSSDTETNKILSNFKKPKTTVYKTKNQGLANTRNYGFKLSKGNFIQFLDADDFLEPDKFEKQIKRFNDKPEIDVSYTNYKYFDDETKKYSKANTNMLIGERNSFDEFVYRWQRGLSIPIHCALFRKSVFDKSGPFISGFKAIEDWLMWVNLAKNACKFNYLDKELAIYRIQSDNMTKNRDFIIYWVSLAISYIRTNFIKKEDLEEFDLRQQEYFKSLINSFYLANQEKKNLAMSSEKDEVIREKEEIIREKDEVIREKENELENLLRSKSYKLSVIISYLPRKLKKQ